MLSVKCWCCGKQVRGGVDWAGRSAKCPNCQSDIYFPPLQPSESASTQPIEFKPEHETTELSSKVALPVATKSGRAAEVLKWLLAVLVIVPIAWTIAIKIDESNQHKEKAEIADAILQSDHASGITSPETKPTLKVAAPLTIESVQSKVTDSYKEITRRAWIVKVRNDGDSLATIAVSVNWLDAEGFVVSHDFVPNLTAMERSTSTFRGTLGMTTEVSDKIVSVEAELLVQ